MSEHDTDPEEWTPAEGEDHPGRIDTDPARPDPAEPDPTPTTETGHETPSHAGRRKGRGTRRIVTIVVGVLVIIAGGVAAGLTATGNAPWSVSEGRQAEPAREGDLGDMRVRIESIDLAGNDSNGKPSVMVTYRVTNNGSKAAKFADKINAGAWQDGHQLEAATMTTPPRGYDPSSAVTDIKPGRTGIVTICNTLRNDTDPVEVTATPQGGKTPSITYKVRLS